MILFNNDQINILYVHCAYTYRSVFKKSVEITTATTKKKTADCKHILGVNWVQINNLVVIVMEFCNSMHAHLWIETKLSIVLTIFKRSKEWLRKSLWYFACCCVISSILNYRNHNNWTAQCQMPWWYKSTATTTNKSHSLNTFGHIKHEQIQKRIRLAMQKSIEWLFVRGFQTWLLIFFFSISFWILCKYI